MILFFLLSLHFGPPVYSFLPIYQDFPSTFSQETRKKQKNCNQQPNPVVVQGGDGCGSYRETVPPVWTPILTPPFTSVRLSHLSLHYKVTLGPFFPQQTYTWIFFFVNHKLI